MILDRTKPEKYIEQMIDAYTRMFGCAPKANNNPSPIKKDDHLELDTGKLLDLEGIQKYQSLIGALQ